MKILMISTEAVPFAKSGGLGDVIGSLPSQLNKSGADVRVMLPLYQDIRKKYKGQLNFLCDFSVTLSWRHQYCGLFSMVQDGVVYYFLDNEQYFKRDSYYGYFDDGERFAFYSMAALESLKYLDFEPEILHCHEWQTALVPVYLKTILREREPWNLLKSVFTIHNIEYQGKFDPAIMKDVFGIDWFFSGLLNYHGSINLLKAAIVCCDKLTTVSKTYAGELLHPYFAHGLDPIIRENQYKFSGIINGVDTERYNPQTDPCLAENYTARNLSKKESNKKDLQQQMVLDEDPDAPVIAIITRLASHKGVDLILRVFEEILREGVQFVVLGTGQKSYEYFFEQQAGRHHGKVATAIKFSEELSHKIYAGADFLLMPSEIEPCGISQMIAMRYGTIPIVRETGGLKDSVQAFNPATNVGNGVTFASYNAHDMLDAIRRSVAYYNEKESWNTLVRNAIKTDLSWKRSTKEYMKLYNTMK